MKLLLIERLISIVDLDRRYTPIAQYAKKCANSVKLKFHFRFLPSPQTPNMQNDFCRNVKAKESMFFSLGPEDVILHVNGEG